MRAVLIGTGMVAQTHIAAIGGTGGRVVLHGVMARRPERARACAQAAAQALGTPPRVYESVEEIASDPLVDLVLLCTPPDARAEIVEILAAAGKPILMEKPIERNTAAARRIVERCEAADVPLGLVFQHRMRASSLRAAEIVSSGALGDLAVVETNIPWWRPQSYYDEPGRGTYARDGGGVMLTQAIHTLELMISLTGPVAAVQAMTRTSRLHNMESEDFVAAGLDFVSGAVGSVVASTASFPGRPEEIVLHCTDGSLHLARGHVAIDWRDGRHEAWGEDTATGSGANPMAFTHAWHQGILEDFVAALEAGRAPRVTGREALRVHALIDAIAASSRDGTRVQVEPAG